MKIELIITKIFSLLLAVITGFTLLSCHKDVPKTDFPDPSTLPSGLIGSWVDTETKVDSIDFTTNNDNGYLWHRSGFGFSKPYLYRLLPDSIYIMNPTSSSRINYGTYLFKFDEPNLTINIASFSTSLRNKNPALTFRKIK